MAIKDETSSQGYNSEDINLDDLYVQEIKLIDSFRINTYIDGEITTENIQNINGKNVKKPDPPEVNAFANSAVYSFKETRCNAFYRILGLPVTDGTSFYNPGYDSDRTNLKNKINIANSFCKTPSGFTSISRFSYFNAILDIFSISDINSSVLSLTLKNKRVFSECVSKAVEKDPTKIDVNDCKYNISVTDVNGKSMMEYKDISLKTPDKLIGTFDEKGESRFHIIFPLITDPRYDFISGNKIVNVPFFCLNPDNHEEDSEIQFQAPGIQSICIQRISSADQKLDLGQNQQDAISYLKDFSSKNTQENLDKIYTDKIQKKDYKFYFSNFINIALSLMKELKKNINIVNEVQSKYNFLPIPTSSGPEFGSIVQKIYANNELNTDNDKSIVELTAAITISDIERRFSSLLTVNSKTTISNDGAADSIVGKIHIFNETDVLNTLLNSAKKARDKECAKANTALKYIEYITGEFSGLGLIDICVITSALYLIDIETLVSLLDDKAYERMADKRFNLSGRPSKKYSSASDALKELSKQICDLYKICDALYKDA